MKAKLLSTLLCIAVLVSTFYLVGKFPSVKPEDTPEEPLGTMESEFVETSETPAAVTEAFVTQTAHDAEKLIDRLAYKENKEYESSVSDLIGRLEKSAQFLKDEMQDYYGATYFTKIAALFKEIVEAPFTDSGNFASRLPMILTELKNSYPPESETKTEGESIYYPKFDTEINGSTSLALLSVYRQQYQKSTDSILITFAGNLFLGDTLLNADQENSFKNLQANKDNTYPLYKLSSVLGTDTVTFANLESPLTESITGNSESGIIKGAPAYASLLKKSSINAVSVANPGVMGYGEQGKTDTKEALEKEKVGFSDEGKIFYQETPLGTVAFLSYDIIEEIQADVNSTYDEAPKQDIAAARENGAKFVVVSFNWITLEQNDWDPCMAQVYTTRAAVENGADLVVGSHPSVIQSIERYNGVTIVYSPGNLFQIGTDSSSFLFQQAFTLNEEGKAVPGDVQIIPLMVSDGIPTIALDAENAQKMKDTLKNVSKTLRYGVEKRSDFTIDQLNIISIAK